MEVIKGDTRSLDYSSYWVLLVEIRLPLGHRRPGCIKHVNPNPQAHVWEGGSGGVKY